MSNMILRVEYVVSIIDIMADRGYAGGEKIGELLEIRKVIFELIHEKSVIFHTKMPVL